MSDLTDTFPIDQHKEHDLRELQRKLEDLNHELEINKADGSSQDVVNSLNDIRSEIEDIFPDAIKDFELRGLDVDDYLFSVQEDDAGGVHTYMFINYDGKAGYVLQADHKRDARDTRVYDDQEGWMS